MLPTPQAAGLPQLITIVLIRIRTSPHRLARFKPRAPLSQRRGEPAHNQYECVHSGVKDKRSAPLSFALLLGPRLI